ncbi:MAG TPA: aldolase/citrate lyase family protein, partial [Dehalococcoidia bacterium]|nr:aldolase/citrate lyase family protein [Dehalococcoidia bacterium]
MIENAKNFKEKLKNGQIPLGCGVSFTDPTVSELFSYVLDFVWIDMEHNAMSLETVQAHIMATKGSDTAALVRVPWNDPVLIKPVLDMGADGIIAPFVRTVEDVELAVAACLYPPDGIRGFGPRRPIQYGRIADADYVNRANEEMIVIVQIEHIDAVNAMDEIINVPGLTGIVIGANDLAGSMGHMGNPQHHEVQSAIETVVRTASDGGIYPGIGLADDPEALMAWVSKGIQWVQVGVDWAHLTRAI